MDVHVAGGAIDRELRRRQLARRLMVHRARTQTIVRLTGLSRHQVATMRLRAPLADGAHRRDKALRSFSAILSPLRTREEAATLAVFWRMLAATFVTNAQGHRLSGIERGERLCDVFEAYRACFPSSMLRFEHLVLLVRGLEQGDAVALSNCGKCGAAILVDLLEARRRACSHCQRAEIFAPTESVPRRKDPGGSQGGADGGIQQELF